MEAPAAVAALAGVLVVAGCAGFAVDSPTTTERPDATDTAVPVTTVGGLSDVEYPVGFSRSGVTDRVVRDRTVALLRDGQIVVTALERFRPGAYADYRYEANDTHARFRLDVHNGYSDITEQAVYVDGSAVYSRQVRDGQLSFAASNGSIRETRHRAAFLVWPVLARILSFADFKAVRAYRVDGERRIRYAVSDIVFRNATAVRGGLVVDGDGLVHEARLRYRLDGEPKRFEYAIRAPDEVRVSVPAWLPAARTER